MKCEECKKKKATGRCEDCGSYYCEDCRDMVDDYCDCSAPNIVDLPKPTAKKADILDKKHNVLWKGVTSN